MFLIIIPAAIGMTVASFSAKWAKNLEIFGSGLGAFFLILACISGIKDNPDLFKIWNYPVRACGGAGAGAAAAGAAAAAAAAAAADSCRLRCSG